MQKPLYQNSSWDFDLLRDVDQAIKEIALNELKLKPYPLQIEIINSEQMIDACASHAMPIMYNHWSYGKRYIQNKTAYDKGHMGLAYEVIINANPSICYLMEENTMTMQTTVIAHCYGHSHFFANNDYFKQWTDAAGIIEYLRFARGYINKAEERYGREAVERTLDACHAVMMQGVDRYRRPSKLSAVDEALKQKEREIAIQKSQNALWSSLPFDTNEKKLTRKTFPEEPQENLLYFFEKHSPILETWQRELCRIVRKVSQYFYPQMQTQVMNEGFATTTHYYIMNRLYDEGLIKDGHMQEFIDSHCGVIFQPTPDKKYYSGINPYALGFDLYSDIRRICETPTKEDEQYFPKLVGQNWVDVILDAAEEHRDSSFIMQYLSPNLIRKWRFFTYEDNEASEHYTISNIHNENGYQKIRHSLGNQYDLNQRSPIIQVVDADLKGDRTLHLHHIMVNNMPLNKYSDDVLKYIRYLWGYSVVLESVDPATGAVVYGTSLKSLR